MTDKILNPSEGRRKDSSREVRLRELEARRAEIRRRRATIGWEKKDWGGQFATRPDNAFTEDWERLYSGEEMKDKARDGNEFVHENSFGHDKRDPMTYHASKESKRMLSAKTRVALEHKAAKALLIAKSLLASDAETESLEDQAAELMDLPTRTLNSTLKRLFSTDGEELDEESLKEKIENLLVAVEEVAEEAGVEVSEEEESEEIGEDVEGLEDAGDAGEEDLGDMDMEEGLGEVEAPEGDDLSGDEITQLLGLSASADTEDDGTAQSFFEVDDIVSQLFSDPSVEASTKDEVAKIDQKLASTQPKGVQRLANVSKDDPARSEEDESIWNVLPDVSDVFANRR